MYKRKRAPTLLRGTTKGITILFEIDPIDVKSWLDQGVATLIDVREREELMQFAIPGAIHIPMSAFNIHLLPTDNEKKLVFVCAHGIRSMQIGHYLLQQNHISEAYNMTGGVAAWADAGLPRLA